MNKQELEQFLTEAKASRTKHSVNDRLFALEVMVSSIAASLEGDTRNHFLKSMNSISETLDPMQDTTIKAIADLNVLGSDFKELSKKL